MNPYYYLFYRLSRVWNKKGNNALGPIGAISILLTANVAVVYFWILPITQENVQGHYKTGIHCACNSDSHREFNIVLKQETCQ